MLFMVMECFNGRMVEDFKGIILWERSKVMESFIGLINIIIREIGKMEKWMERGF